MSAAWFYTRTLLTRTRSVSHLEARDGWAGGAGWGGRRVTLWSTPVNPDNCPIEDQRQHKKKYKSVRINEMKKWWNIQFQNLHLWSLDKITDWILCSWWITKIAFWHYLMELIRGWTIKTIQIFKIGNFRKNKYSWWGFKRPKYKYFFYILT